MENMFPVVAATDIEPIRQSELSETARRDAVHAGRLLVDC